MVINQAMLNVFSTSVEVFLTLFVIPPCTMSLLHVRGGVSESGLYALIFGSSSPRPWRCFWPARVLVRLWIVFSTSVEVFPQAAVKEAITKGLLHVRGGVS